MILVLCLLVALMLLPYVVGPLLVRERFRHRREPEAVPIELIDVPSAPRAYLEQGEQALVAAGFEPAGRALLSTVPGVTAWISVLVHRENRDLAQVAAVGRCHAGALATLEACHVELATRLHDRELLTNNSRQVMPFGALRGQLLVRFVDMDDVSLLYRIHRARVRAHGPSAPAELPEPGRELEDAAASTRRYVEAQVVRGNLQLLATEEAYGLTWRGAVRATWKHLWPFRGRDLRWARRAALRFADSLDFEVPADQVGTADAEETAATARSA